VLRRPIEPRSAYRTKGIVAAEEAEAAMRLGLEVWASAPVRKEYVSTDKRPTEQAETICRSKRDIEQLTEW
jgi:hypothetical protein